MKVISFVIPVYRNKGSLTITYDRIKAMFEKELSQYDFELIFVNDGSDDGSLEELLEIRNGDKRVKVYDLTRNFGQRFAVLCGFSKATGDGLVKMSADLQEPFEKIPEMVREWENGNDVVICYRDSREDHIVDQFFSQIFYRMVRLSNPNFPKGGFDFFFLSKRALHQLNKINYRNRFLQGDVLGLGYKVSFIPGKRLKRTIGKSQQTFKKRVNFFIDGFLNSSYLPIRFMSSLGILSSIFGMTYAIIIVAKRLLNDDPTEGWASIMAAIFFLSGLIMLMLGIVGEYLWRISDEVKRKPIYFVKEEYADEDSSNSKKD